MTDDPRIQVPDDLSGLTEQTEQLWEVVERLVLNDGTELNRIVCVLPYEPHLGNLSSATNSAMQTLTCNAYHVLRFRPDDASLFFTPLSNVHGIYIDVVCPDGETLSGSSIKPGYAPTRPDDVPPGD